MCSTENKLVYMSLLVYTLWSSIRKICIKIQSLPFTWQVINPLSSQDKILLPYTQLLLRGVMVMGNKTETDFFLKKIYIYKIIVRIFLLKSFPEKPDSLLASAQLQDPEGREIISNNFRNSPRMHFCVSLSQENPKGYESGKPQRV